MKARSSIILFAILLTSGCAVYNVRLYPVQGPLSAQTPVPVFIGKVTLKVNSGHMSVVLGNGEVCKGRWTSAPATPANSMSTVWDTVYGQGYYASHILGKPDAPFVVPCDRGTVLTLDMYAPNGTYLRGVAKDSNGNIYKTVFKNVP